MRRRQFSEKNFNPQVEVQRVGSRGFWLWSGVWSELWRDAGDCFDRGEWRRRVVST